MKEGKYIRSGKDYNTSAISLEISPLPKEKK
jgi:hypothetical protein